jgi:hypothetical protein
MLQKSIIMTNDFAHFLGFFAADGSFYMDGRNTRFEFSDGSSVKDDLHYSKAFLEYVRKKVGVWLEKNMPPLRKRGNRYVLSFRSKTMESLFIKLGFNSGYKTDSIRLPKIYRKTKLERYFWIGVLDGDGMIARNSRKLSLESISENLIKDFCNYLRKNVV